MFALAAAAHPCGGCSTLRASPQGHDLLSISQNDQSLRVNPNGNQVILRDK